MRRLHLLCVLVVVACGGARHAERPTIEDLRRRAEARPSDLSAQYNLAEGELLLPGGDASRARSQIARAAELAPEDIRLAYLAATERELHGDLSEALDGYIDVIRRARTSHDPLAPAMAAIAAAELESEDDAVERYAERISEALATLHSDPGRIGDEARSTMADLAIDIAYRRGDLARVRDIVEAQRCVGEWRIAGPFGPRHLLGYDRDLAPDADDTLAAEYDLGPGRGRRATREVSARGCNVHVGGGPIGGPGTTFAEARIEIPVAGRWVLRLETPNAVQLEVDGERIALLDRRREPMPRATYHEVTLDAGEHRVRVRISSRHPNPVLSLSLSQTAGTPGGDPIEGETLVADYVRAQSAMVRGDVVAAREHLRTHLSPEGASAFLVAGAAATLNDPLRGGTVRHDTARRLLGWARERDDRSWYPHLALARLEANEGRDEVAIELLRDAMERWPTVVMFPLQLVDYLEQRGWRAQALEAIERARSAVPTACRPRRAAMNHARRRHRAAEVMEHARALVECDARSDAVLTQLVRRREWDEALEEVRRLAALEPRRSPIGQIQAELGIATSRGDDDSVGRLLTRLIPRIPQSSGLVLREADRILATGGEQGARARMSEALVQQPAPMMDLRRVLRAIGGGSPLEAHRRDGAEVIRELEASDRVYDGPMLLVFDYTVYRVFGDGSMLELTHNIFRLDSQEAVDAMGEFHVPDDAQMLTLQTVKADGTRLEPDEIAGKETISFPNLEPGDYIEFEYLRPHAASVGYPGGFIGERFYFRNYETPFDVSMLTVVTPAGVELTIDPRGAAPELEVAEVDGTRVHRWTVRESRPFSQEPESVAVREFFPSIYWGRGATWDLYVESLRDVLADRDVIDPAARRLVRGIVGDDHRATVEQRAERIYRWVLRSIEDSEDVFALAPAMVAARTGNRTRVLRYLLDIAGIETELALARSYAADATRSELADDETYQNLLVRIRGSDGWRWLYAGARGAPFGYLPPRLAGMDALLLNEAAERVRVGERPADADLRSVEVDIDLHRDGGARVVVVETYRGSGAVLWRDQLEGIAERNLETEFESEYLANLLPGARLTRLVISGREDPEAPLVLRYEATLASLARVSGSTFVIPPIYRAMLGAQHAGVASRTVTQLVAEGFALDVEVRLRVPEGATIRAVPEDVSRQGVHGAWTSISVERDGGELLIRRSYRLPRMRITPDEYAGFASFCRASDEGEAAEIRVRM